MVQTIFEKSHSSSLAVMTAEAQLPMRAWPMWHWLFLLGLMVLQLLAAYGSNGTYDTYRDLFFATQIANGDEFPLSGPGIFQTIHLGPLWFYLLAGLIWILPSAINISLIIGFLGALKFPLAYALGLRFAGTRGGLLFAAALMLPGWSAFPVVSLTHTTVVETTVLFAALMTLRYLGQNSLMRGALLAVSLAFMLHAHPTTLLIALWLFTLAVYRSDNWRNRLVLAAQTFFMAILCLLPMLVDQANKDFSDFTLLQQYASTGTSTLSVWRYLSLLASIFSFGADYIARYWFALTDSAHLGWVGLNLSTFILPVLGLATLLRVQARSRQLVFSLIALLLVQTAFVLLLRPVTPFWMVYAHWPLIAALLALGLSQVWGWGKTARILVGATVLFWCVWSAAALLFLSRSPSDLLIESPPPGGNGLMNIAEYQNQSSRIHFARLPLSASIDLSRTLCQPTQLYAHYAKFVDHSFAIGAQSQCGNTAQILLGGKRVETHQPLLGLRETVWQALDIQPPQRIGKMGMSSDFTVLNQSQTLLVVRPDHYPPRKLSLSADQFTVTVEVPADQALLIAQRADGYAPFKAISASANGVLQTPRYHDLITVAYAPIAPNNQPVQWQLTIYAAQDFVDVLALPSVNNPSK